MMINSKIIILLLLSFSLFFLGCAETGSPEVAKINGQTITLNELDHQFLLFGSKMNKLQYLNDVLIPSKILFQVANSQNITLTALEMSVSLNHFLQNKGMKKEEYLGLLEDYGISKKEFLSYIAERLVVSKFAILIIPPKLISETELIRFYNSNKEIFKDKDGHLLTVGESRESIEHLLNTYKSEIELRKIVETLGQRGEILIYHDNLY